MAMVGVGGEGGGGVCGGGGGKGGGSGDAEGGGEGDGGGDGGGGSDGAGGGEEGDSAGRHCSPVSCPRNERVAWTGYRCERLCRAAGHGHSAATGMHMLPSG